MELKRYHSLKNEEKVINEMKYGTCKQQFISHTGLFVEFISAMTTQYKTMQTKKNYTIHQLERELTQTTKQLSKERKR